MVSDIRDNGSIWHKKRIILKYVDKEQIELFLEVLKAIAEENFIRGYQQALDDLESVVS